MIFKISKCRFSKLLLHFHCSHIHLLCFSKPELHNVWGLPLTELPGGQIMVMKLFPNQVIPRYWISGVRTKTFLLDPWRMGKFLRWMMKIFNFLWKLFWNLSLSMSRKGPLAQDGPVEDRRSIYNIFSRSLMSTYVILINFFEPNLPVTCYSPCQDWRGPLAQGGSVEDRGSFQETLGMNSEPTRGISKKFF